MGIKFSVRRSMLGIDAVVHIGFTVSVHSLIFPSFFGLCYREQIYDRTHS